MPELIGVRAVKLQPARSGTVPRLVTEAWRRAAETACVTARGIIADGADTAEALSGYPAVTAAGGGTGPAPPR